MVTPASPKASEQENHDELPSVLHRVLTSQSNDGEASSEMVPPQSDRKPAKVLQIGRVATVLAGTAAAWRMLTEAADDDPHSWINPIASSGARSLPTDYKFVLRSPWRGRSTG